VDKISHNIIHCFLVSLPCRRDSLAHTVH